MSWNLDFWNIAKKCVYSNKSSSFHQSHNNIVANVVESQSSFHDMSENSFYSVFTNGCKFTLTATIMRVWEDYFISLYKIFITWSQSILTLSLQRYFKIPIESYCYQKYLIDPLPMITFRINIKYFTVSSIDSSNSSVK